MNKKQNGLGKGISAILPSTQNFSEIDISTIQTNPFQPRNKFDESTLEELASSIIKLGIIQPITVHKKDTVIQSLVMTRTHIPGFGSGFKLGSNFDHPPHPHTQMAI